MSILAPLPRDLDLAVLDLRRAGAPRTAPATRLLREHASIRVVLMSGNPGDEAANALVADGVPFLQKPFATLQLAALVRQVLDAPSA
jgi:DNA-binding NtrC family response regulator